MKNIIITHLILFTFVFSGYAQWQSDTRLTNNSGSSITNTGKCIVSVNNYLHILWTDNRDGNYEVYYKHSTNAGLNWIPDMRLTGNSGYTYAPSISAEGTNVYISFSDDRTGNFEIYFMKSTNNGLNWSNEVMVSTNDAYHSYQSDVKAGVYVYVAWLEERGDLDIYFTRSSNYGSSWSIPVRINPNIYPQKYPVLSVSGSNVHCVFQDERFGISNTEVFYMRSTNNGINWSGEMNISDHSGFSYNGYVFSYGSTVHIVWDDDWAGNREIFYRRSTNNGVDWSGNTILTINAGTSGLPSIKASGNYTHLVWEDDRDGNREIYYSFSSNNGSSWGSDLRLTNSAGYSGTASLCLAGNIVNVLWYDARNGNNEIYYKRNPTGNPVGVTLSGTEIPAQYSLEQNYPNPFNPTTNFEFRIADFGLVNLAIYNILGREIETLVNENLKPGIYKADWNASENSSGVYFYKISAGSFTETKRMILLK